MVWFDCQCGESLKKPAVAKHFMARGCSQVSCVDCSQTFYGQEFETHIKCISEAQKYMGKLFDADSGKKEGAKQDSWLEAVTKTLAEYNGPLKPLVEKLAMYDNIPRKQKAFENFVANSLNLKRDIVTVSKLWNIVEPCLKEKSQAGDTNGKSPKPWRSYEEETEELLRANGGSMPWKLLQAHLTKRRRTVFPQENLDEIKLKVLANIPVQFLSESSKNVSV